MNEMHDIGIGLVWFRTLTKLFGRASVPSLSLSASYILRNRVTLGNLFQELFRLSFSLENKYIATVCRKRTDLLKPMFLFVLAFVIRR